MLRPKCGMVPNDNFSHIDPKCEFAHVEIWRQFGKYPKWRVEKPGRVILMDGASTLAFMRPNLAYKLPFATEGAFDSGRCCGLGRIETCSTA